MTDDVQLLVDEHHILYRAGTKRVFHPLRRHPNNPVLKGRTKPWEIAIAYCSVHRDSKSGRWQTWYQSFAGDVAKDRRNRCTVCYAESDDGLTWTRPAFSLFPFNGQKETNIVVQANGGTSDRYGASVLFDPVDPDESRRYKLAHFDFVRDATGRDWPGLCVAFSPDGIHWTKHAGGPLLRAAYGTPGDLLPYSDTPEKGTLIPLSVADAFDAMYDPVRNHYAIYGKMWIDGPDGHMFGKHAAHRAISKDFIHWEKPQLCMTPDDEDPGYVEFHTTPVFFHAGCYFAAPEILHRSEGGGVMDVELAISRDGFNFSRPFRKEFWLARGAKGQFDSGTLLTNATPVVLEDEIRFYYGGYSGGATGGDDYSFTTGIGLATLPRDRFAGVRAVDGVGQITLKPFDLSGVKGIVLNADASRGTVMAELLDANGYRVRGFAVEDAEPLSSASLRHHVRWKGGSSLPAGPHHLRLHLRGEAEVFAVTFDRKS